ncbi:hypothetical protein, partial [Paenibacillus sp.]|uniref:hypothetical protein n=1 Tax=Paenibacillus sp. TaxID=58172 RepID=UPI002D5A6E6E
MTHPLRLPPLLAGPIVRRSEPRRLTLWVATSRRYRMDAALFDCREPERPVPFEAHTSVRVARLGMRLFVSLVELRPPEGSSFPAGVPLGYNITFASEDGAFDLEGLGLLDAAREDGIVYPPYRYPTVALPADESAPIVHGSCRKPHGRGEDALAAADRGLARICAEGGVRPQALFLTGDQIYADDVADALLPPLRALGRRLVGDALADESARADDRLGDEPLASAARRIRGRQFIAERLCRFTSEHAHNHLLDFHEYASMYLLAWSPEPWRALREAGAFASFDERCAAGDVHFVFAGEEPRHLAARAKERRRYRRRYEQDAARLRRFERTLPAVRRLLANVPTYMLFDDHDVTDDWNLSAEWKERVWHAPLGRSVVASALTAYWAFQGWGNDPDAFDASFLAAVEARCEGPAAPGSQTYDEWVRTLWWFDGWSFAAPTLPRAIFLDTRTMRAYDLEPVPEDVFGRAEETAPTPRLLHRHGWQLARSKLLESGWTPGEGVAVVSPPPLYGIGLVETMLRRHVYPLRAIGLPVHAMLDFEAWKYNERGFYEALDWIIGLSPRYCVVLSGDVHSASAVAVRVERADPDEPTRSLPIVQYTCSPLRNESYGGAIGFVMKRWIDWNAWRRKRGRLVRRGSADGRFLRGAAADGEGARWTERIRYLPIGNGSIVDFGNNAGWLRLSRDGAAQTICSLLP